MFIFLSIWKKRSVWKTYWNVKNDDYTLGNLLNYSYQQKLIAIDLDKQTNTSIPQQINFAEKLEKDDGAT